METKIPTIIICGPTASGKTAISIALSKIMNIEVISADARQLYKYLDIGTAKPSKEEQNAVKHHFIDCLNPDQNYSAGEFGNAAYKAIQDIVKRSNVPVVVGGAGFYIKALCEGLFYDEGKTTDNARNYLQERLATQGIDYLYEQLKIIDEPLYLQYTDKNPRRIMRGLEYYYSNGKRLSDARQEVEDRTLIFPMYYMLEHPRNLLYNKINKRVDEMWKAGLVEETENVLNMGYSENLNALNTVGYKEVIAYLKGKMTKNDAINEIKKNTRHYAKRQMTWFNKVNGIRKLNNELSPFLLFNLNSKK